MLLVLIEERKHLAKLPNLIKMLCLRSAGLAPHIHVGLKVRSDIKPNASAETSALYIPVFLNLEYCSMIVQEIHLQFICHD